MSREVNLTSKNIREFTPDNTIYIQKVVAGFSTSYLCQFVKYERGVVHGEIISGDPNPKLHERKKGQLVSSRLNKCFLWGKPNEGTWVCCNWFGKEGFANK